MSGRIVEDNVGDGKTTVLLTIAAMLAQSTPPPASQDDRRYSSEHVASITTLCLTNKDEITDSGLRRFLSKVEI